MISARYVWKRCLGCTGYWYFGTTYPACLSTPSPSSGVYYCKSLTSRLDDGTHATLGALPMYYACSLLAAHNQNGRPDLCPTIKEIAPGSPCARNGTLTEVHPRAIVQDVLPSAHYSPVVTSEVIRRYTRGLSLPRIGRWLHGR